MSASTAGSEIYHWVDENGVQHFSQTTPIAATGPVETMTLENPQPPTGAADEDLYDIAATADRTRALREQLEQRREDRRERERTAPAQPAQQYAEPLRYASPWWWNQPGIYPPPRPPRPKPPLVPEPYPTAKLKPLGGISG